ncbi:hypothetical protein CLV58_10610 [Spirosoma oryzae]|uniref:DNA replication protein DnaC n=1 Tax=Spirosoma oryzae TaxID=1469603 RepID=A0A2T0T586_9BACT|nr:hypothetical protein CLV58_10610 [Spirosoma oryzae]
MSSLVQYQGLISGYPSPGWPELTDDEIREAIEAALPHVLKTAQKEKHYRLEREKQALKEAQLSHVPESPEEFFVEVQIRGRSLAKRDGWRKPFELDTWRWPYYKLLSLYFMGDERFETEGPALLGYEDGSFSLSKGLLLAGGVGVGKSDMMRLFARNPWSPFQFVSCIDLAVEYSDKEKGGSKVIDQHVGPRHTEKRSFYYGHDYIGTCFDDFGAEGETSYMGNRVNLMELILQGRYRNCRGPWTHITTNASEADIKTNYDHRVYDRMIQMFNFIEYPADTPSLRC